MGTITLQTLFQDAYPAYEQTYPVLRILSFAPGRGPDAVPYGARATAGGRAGVSGLADGVCAVCAGSGACGMGGGGQGLSTICQP